jgi:endonuclease-3
VTENLFKVAPTPKELMNLELEQVTEIIKSVGLAPSKAKYLLGLSKKIVEDFEGDVPNSMKDLESLPGVGRKTASVVMSQVYGVPSFAVDTHVLRLAVRTRYMLQYIGRWYYACVVVESLGIE